MASTDSTNDAYSKLGRQMLAGAAAGAVTKTTVAPLERVKILRQIQGMQKLPPKYITILQSLRLVYAEDGIRGWFRGNGANVLRVVPVYALKFAFNDMFKAWAVPKDQVSPPTTRQLLTAGWLAGTCQNLVTAPLETLRTRLSIGPAYGLHYRGIWDCAVKTVRGEGVTALYKGIGPTLVTSSPYVALQMTFYDLVRRKLPTNADGQTSVVWKLTAGAVAGLCAQSITYPGDTLRKRMQFNGAGGTAAEEVGKRVYSSSFDCIRTIIRTEGVMTFYHGWGTNAVRALPGAGIQFAAYDMFKSLLDVE